MRFDPVSAPAHQPVSDPSSDSSSDSSSESATEPARPVRAVPWVRVALVAGVALVGLLVALAVLAPVLVLGGLLWLALLGVAAWRLALRTWGRESHVPPRPGPVAVEALAEAHRAAARERHARTVAVVSAGLVGPGFTRRG